MSKQEVKEEFKQMEGDPQIKSKIKQRQQQMATQRMMHDVPKADVVVRNPTHFAVALKYDQDKNNAPQVLAKGKDLIALRIVQIAEENDVMTIETRRLPGRFTTWSTSGGRFPRSFTTLSRRC